MAALDRLSLSLPIVQAPMAGVSTPVLAAAVSNAGGLGSLGLGTTDATGARAMIAALRDRTDRAFNVNLFVHATARRDQAREAAWMEALAPLFRSFGAEPPASLRTIYRSFIDDDEMFGALLRAGASGRQLPFRSAGRGLHRCPEGCRLHPALERHEPG